MRRSLVLLLAVALLAGGLAALQPAAAQPNMKHPINEPTQAATAPPAGAEAPVPGSMRAMTLRQVVAAQEKLVALAEAMPADKYGWRPGEGVRSVGEVFMHVASANFFLPTFWGAKMPARGDPGHPGKEG